MSSDPQTDPALRRAPALRIAALLSVLWLLGAGLALWALPPDTSLGGWGWVMGALALILPLALIWLAAGAAQATAALRAETAHLRASIEAMDRPAPAPQRDPEADKALDRALSQMMALSRKTEDALARLQPGPGSAPAPAQPTGQPSGQSSGPQPAYDSPADKPADLLGGFEESQSSLPLVPAETPSVPPVTSSDLIQALNFPDSPDDAEGFAALHRALEDRQAAQVIQASQDVLTLLSQDGVYMDDLDPDRARPELWRRFAEGERGGPLTALGGVRDRKALALSATRMREDTIFRDAAHHFLRKFDQLLVRFEKDSSDEEIAALMSTRTACAFMLLGRAAGAFD